MTLDAVLLGALLLVLTTLCARPLGHYIAAVMAGQPNVVARLGAPLERFVYRVSGIDPAAETGWKRYALDVLLFSVIGVLFAYLLQRMQRWLPLNPEGLGNVSADSSFNTAVSFVTNTNWQGYVGE